MATPINYIHVERGRRGVQTLQLGGFPVQTYGEDIKGINFDLKVKQTNPPQLNDYLRSILRGHVKIMTISTWEVFYFIF